MNTRRITYLVILPALLLGSLAWGYVLEYTSPNGANLHWQSMPVGWYMNETNAGSIKFNEALPAMAAAFDSWQSVECSSLTFEYKGSSNVGTDDVGTTNHDGKNVMIWVNESDFAQEWQDAFAVTVPVFEQASGKIVDADILFKASFNWSTSSEGLAGRPDVQSIGAHEVGHLLGLDHPDDPDSTMFPTAVEGEIHKRTLAADDIQGICKIYPVEGVTGYPCDSAADCNGSRSCVAHTPSNGNICSNSCECSPDCSPAFRCIGQQCLPPKIESGGGMGAQCSEIKPCGGTQYICLNATCTIFCDQDEECPESWGCIPLVGGDSACYQGAQLGEACDATTPCGSSDLICVSSLCTTYCDSVDDCPDDWECVPLQGGDKACFTDDPPPPDEPDPVDEVTITSFGASPSSPVYADVDITLTCNVDAPGDVLYRFSSRKVDENNWTVIKSFSESNLTHWIPSVVGSYELMVEVKLTDSEECADAEQRLSFMVIEQTDSAEDGDVDGDLDTKIGETGDFGSGFCKTSSIGNGILLGFLLGLMALWRRRETGV